MKTATNRISAFYLLIFLMPLVFNPWGGPNSFEAVKQSWIFLVVGVAAVLLASYVTFHRSLRAIAFHRGIFCLLGLWAASYALSTFFSMAPIESFWGTYERLQGLITYLYYLAHFVLCLHIFHSKDCRRLFMIVTVLVGAVVSIYGTMQYFGLDFLSARSSPTLFGRRIFSSIGNPTQLGQFLIFPFFVSLIYAASAFKQGRFRLVVAGSSVCMLSIATMWLAHSRAALGAVLVTSLFLLIYHVRKKLFVPLLLFFGCTFLAAVFFFVLFGDMRSLNARFILWRAAAPLVLQNPVLGSGPETLYQTLQTTISPSLYQYERLSDIPDRTHNELIDILLTNGVFGGALYMFNLFFLGWIFVKKKLQSPAGKAALFSLIAYYMSTQLSFSLSTQMIFLLGMWAVLLHELRASAHITIKLLLGARIAAAAVLIAAAFFSFNFAYRLSSSDVLFGKFLSAYFQGSREGLNAFERITAVAPNYSYLYNSLFIFYNSMAKEDPFIASELTRYAGEIDRITAGSFKSDFALSQLAQAVGNQGEAEGYFASMLAKAPHWTEGWLWRGRDAFERGDYALAQWALERYVSYAPDYAKQFEPTGRYRIFAISHPQYFEALELLRRAKSILATLV